MERETNSRALSGPSYEVFLSFRGPDTRHGFTDCLYHGMVAAGILVFRDDESLRVGERIGGELLQAIDKSKIYIPVFSTNYASSHWCLRELAYMVECTSKSNGNKEILPIFFDVEPVDVKLKTTLYRQNLSQIQKTFGTEVKSWEKALTDVGNRRGWNLKKDEGQGNLIQSVIQAVLAKLNVNYKNVTEHLVGVDDRVEAIIKILDVESDSVQFLAIHGMGGVGKTTLAKVIFNRLSSQFQDCSFLSDVRESSERHGLVYLQKQLLSKFLDSRFVNQIHDVDGGINMIKRVLCNKKVLIVLDGMDEEKQLKSLAAKANWFGSGSRVIITTRYKSVLMIDGESTSEGPVKSASISTYEVQEMKFHHALKLFSRHAFRRDFPPDHFVSLSEKVVSTLGKLPLALEVTGSSLSSKSKEFWVDTLKKLEKAPSKEVQKTLMITYERLDDAQRQVFLDISCFFVNEDKTYPFYMWDDCECFPNNAIEVLCLMSLIKIKDDNTIWMHDQVRDLGRAIVREENFNYPCERSRVWNHQEALNILKQKEGSRKIEALSLGNRGDILMHDEVANLRNLRFLEGNGVFLVGDFTNLFSNLRWFSWRWCPHEFVATNFHLINLVVLDLSHSYISEKWIGWDQIRVASKLKVLDLRNCEYLRRTPDLSTLVSLERLILEGCRNLIEVDSSIGKLKLLTTLNLKGCDSLQELPEEIGCLQALTEIAMPNMLHEHREGVKPGTDDAVILAEPRLQMNVNDENGVSSSKSGSSERNFAASETSIEGSEKRALGVVAHRALEVVARLMGLDSLPKSNGPESSTSCSEFHQAKASPYSDGTHDLQSRCDPIDYLSSSSRLGRFSSHPAEAKLLKEQKRPIERFQTEILPSKSAKPISITHNRLLSPMKGPGFIPAKNVAYVMEAAAKIIESSPRVVRSKASSTVSASVPLRIHDLKMKLESACEASRQQKASSSGSVKNMKGNFIEKSYKIPQDTQQSRTVVVSGKVSSGNWRFKGKSSSLAEPGKVNVQTREAKNLLNKKNLAVEKVQSGENSSQVSNGLSWLQKSSQRITSTNRTNIVLKQNNQKQNSLSDRQGSVSRASRSKQPVGRTQPVNGSIGPSETASKIAVKAKTGSTTKSATDISKELKSSRLKTPTHEINSVNSDINSNGSVTANVLINSDGVFVKRNTFLDGGVNRGVDSNKNGMDVISSTFSSPMKRCSREPHAYTGMHENGNFDRSFCGDNGSLDCKDSSSSSPIESTSDGDILSVLFERKRRELTDRIDLSNCDISRVKSLSVPKISNGESVGTLNSVSSVITETEESFQQGLDEAMGSPVVSACSSSDGPTIDSKQECQGVPDSEETEECSSGATSYGEADYEHPTRVSTLESSFVSESCTDRLEEEEDEKEVDEIRGTAAGSYSVFPSRPVDRQQDSSWSSWEEDDDDDGEEAEEEEEEFELLSLLSKERRTTPDLGDDWHMLVSRDKAVEWMLQARSVYGFSALTAVLAVDYLDRFLPCFGRQLDKPWMTQLVAVTCLSLAAKVEETRVPLLLDLQVGDVSYVFEARTVQRMELLVLSTLGWRMHPVTPLSFVHHVASTRLGAKRPGPSRQEFLRCCERFLVVAASDSRSLSYRPSLLAAAVMAKVVKDDVRACFGESRRQQRLLNQSSP